MPMENQILDDTDLQDRFVPSIDTQVVNDKKVYDYALDGLRGLAAIWVAYSHIFYFKFALDPEYHPTLPVGYLFNAAHGGILIFFTLSGYVIGLTNQLPFSRTNAIGYLLRRFIRLYPIYVIAIILGILSDPTDTWKTIVGNFLFLQVAVSALLKGNGVLWTLHYEVVYYIVFLAVWYFRPKVIPLMVGALIVAFLSLFIPAFPSLISGYAAGWVFWLFGLWLAWKKPRSDSFAKFPLFAYILLFIATDKLTIGESILNNLGLSSIKLSSISITDFVYFPLCVLLFGALTQRYIPHFRVISAISLFLPLAQTTYLLATGQLFITQGWLIGSAHMVLGFALLSWKTSSDILSKLSFFGSISYGIYVFHMPLMSLMHYVSIFSGSSISFTIRAFIWAGLTIGLSYLCELKLQPIIKRWFQLRVTNHL